MRDRLADESPMLLKITLPLMHVNTRVRTENTELEEEVQVFVDGVT